MRVSFKIFWALLTLVFLLGISIFAGAVDKPFAAPPPSGGLDIFITSDEDLFDEVNKRAIEYGLTVCGE